MPMRSSSLANNPLAITRELDGRYDVVLQVRDNLDLIEQVAGVDFAAILAELESAQDFTGITVVQGETVAWDAVNKILTVPKGDKGDKGDTGLTGPQGTQGIQGPQGIKGDTGLKGDTGSQGPKGFDGAAGAQGLKGDTGDDLTITQITYNGNGTFNWQFSDGTSYVTPNLRGPKGDTGSKGDKGDTGASVNHIKGTSTTDNEGNFGSEGETDTYTMYADIEEQFVLGWFVVKNGSSPYTFAVAEGYAGTKEEFYNELANVRTYAELAENSAISADADAAYAAAERIVVESARDVTVAAKDLAVTSADIVQTIFLGTKSVDPIVDNQGDPLATGVMYYNDVLGTLKIWTGTEWTMAAFSADGAVFSFNGRDGFITLTNADITTAVGKSLTDAIKYSEADKVLTDVNKLNLSTDTNLVAGVGQMTWNPDENTVDIGLNGATLQVGQEQLIRVTNNSGTSIDNGMAVMATGTVGNSGRITVAKANLTQANAKFVLGVVTETIANGADGFVTTFGKVRGINTSGSQYGETWLDGDVLYVKDSGSGALTKVVPTDTQVKLPVAIVISAHGSNGTLFVRVNSIDENHAKVELATKVNKNADIVAGTGTKITYDTKGLVTGSTALNASDIPSLDASKITSGTLSVNTSGNAATATKVNNTEVIKFDTGVIEGTDLYTFDGSVSKTINIKAGTNVTLTKAAGSVTINANDTSIAVTEITGMGAGASTFLATPTSTNLAAMLTDETGTGAVVFANSPTLTGTPLATTAAVGTNTTQVATTAYVIAEINKIEEW